MKTVFSVLFFAAIFTSGAALSQTTKLKKPALNKAPSKVQPPPPFTLLFPLVDGGPDISYPQGAYTPNRITSFLDHSMKKNISGWLPYGSLADGGADGIIVTFDGQTFSGKPDTKDQTCITGSPTTDAGPAGLLGRLQKTGGCRKGYISYDEHPGYDFSARPGASVLATASGSVVNINGEPCVKINITGSCAAWGAVGIDHGNGFISQFLHLDRVDVLPGDMITQGQIIGISGSKAPVKLSPHLHFELINKISAGQVQTYQLVDPYGWSGSGFDPLTISGTRQSKPLWSLTPPESGVTADSAATAFYDKQVVSGKATFDLPPKSRIVYQGSCNKEDVDLVQKNFPDLGRCVSMVRHNSRVVAILTNRQRTSENPGRIRIVLLSPTPKDLGSLSAPSFVVNTIWEDREIEFLPVMLDGWSGRPSDPPYARFRLANVATSPVLNQIPVVGSPSPSALEKDKLALQQKKSGFFPIGLRITSDSGQGQTGYGSNQPTASSSSANSSLSESCKLAKWSGTIQNLADLFDCDTTRAIQLMSQGQMVQFRVSRMAFSNGFFVGSMSQQPSRLSQGVARMQKNFNWGDWMSVTQGQRTFTFQCRFPVTSGSNLKEGAVVAVRMTLKSYQGDSGQFECT